MLKRDKEERNQAEIFCIEEFVPKDHLLRKIDSAIDFTHIYDIVEELTVRITEDRALIGRVV